MNHPQGSIPGKETLTEPTTEDAFGQNTVRPPNPQSAPGKGTNATKKRNARRKKKEQLQRQGLKAASLASNPEPSTEQRSEPHVAVTCTDQEMGNEADLLEARKLSLLQAIGPEDERTATFSEQDGEPALVHLPRASIPSKDYPPKDVSLSGHTDGMETIPETRDSPRDLRDQAEQEKSTAHSQTALEEADAKRQARRSRLDTASTKRLIFGSLGLRTPKSKKEEDDLRNRLKPKAKDPLQSAVQENGIDSSMETVNHDQDSWKDHVVLKAVECCHDGVELSTPPFPFIQRWDPQQQAMSGKSRGSRGGGKSKRQKRNNSQYYQEYNGFDDYEYDQTNVQNVDTSNLEYETLDRNDGIANPLASSAGPEDPSVMRPSLSRSESERTQAAVNQQIFQDAGGYSPAGHAAKGLDLPELPSDLAKCEILTTLSAKEGAIIAFKSMEMSEKTNWCPIISPFRTAKIEGVLEDGSVAIVLASRDVPSKRKRYDPDTGERVYDRFEMPSDDDEDEVEEDDSRIELSLLDMIEPKLIESAKGFPDEDMGDQTSHSSPKEEPASNQKIQTDESGLETVSLRYQEDQPASSQSNLDNDQATKEMSESTRREYSLLMKDAGFRSDVAANVTGAFAQGPRVPSTQEEETSRLGSKLERESSEVNDSNLVEGFIGDNRCFLESATSPDERRPETQGPSRKRSVVDSDYEDRVLQPPSSAKSYSSWIVEGDGPMLDGPLSSRSPNRSALEDEYDEQEVAESSLLPSESADPELFPVSAQSPEIPFTSSPPTAADIKSAKRGNHFQEEAQESSILGDDSLPLPGDILSQPKPRSRKTDEDWDAEYVPPSTAPAGLSSGVRNKKKPTRRGVFAIPSSPIPSDDSQSDNRDRLGSKLNTSYGLDGSNDMVDDYSDDFKVLPPAPKRRHSPKIKRESSQVPAGRVFPSTAPVSGIHVIDLTASSDIETRSSKMESEEDRTKSIGLPRGPGWVPKAKPSERKGKDRSVGRTRSSV